MDYEHEKKIESLNKLLKIRSVHTGPSKGKTKYLAQDPKKIKLALEFIAAVAASPFIKQDRQLTDYKKDPVSILDTELYALNLVVSEIDNTHKAIKARQSGRKFLEMFGKEDEENKSISTASESGKFDEKIVDFYEVLGVSPDASKEEIRKAYRTKIKQVHPDVVGEKGKDKAIELNTAFNILYNDTNRECYNKILFKSKEKTPKTKAPSLPPRAPYPNAILNITPTTDRKTRKVSRKTLNHLKTLKEVDLVEINNQVLSELRATNQLPKNINGDDIRHAFMLRSYGVDSMNLIQKTYESIELSSQQKEKFLKIGWVMFALEQEFPTESEDIRKLSNYPYLKFQVNQEPSKQPQPNQIVFSVDPYGDLRFIGEEIKEKSIDFIKSKTKKILSKAFKKGIQKISTALLKKASELGINVAAQTSIEAAGVTGLAAAVGIPTGGIGAAIVAAVAVTYEGVKRVGNKILTLIFQEKDPKKRRELVLITLGGIFILAEAPFVGIPLIVVGVASTASIISLTSPIILFVSLIGKIIAVIITAILTNFVIAITSFILLVTFVFLIINMGAYMVPPGGFGIDTEQMISGTWHPGAGWPGGMYGGIYGGFNLNPFISVEKTASITELENSDPATQVTYTITVCASNADLHLNSMDCDCNIISDTTVSCEGYHIDLSDVVIPANRCTEIPYTRTINPSDTPDSATSDRCTVTAFADNNGVSNSDGATVIIGEPPFECPHGSPMYNVEGLGCVLFGGSGYTPEQHGYEAIDINAASGDDSDLGWEIHSTHGGIVLNIGYDPTGYGTYVDILGNCNGTPFVTRYAHLRDVDGLSIGQAVVYGELIAHLGNSGAGGGPNNAHLHYEYREYTPDSWRNTEDYSCAEGSPDPNLPCIWTSISQPVCNN